MALAVEMDINLFGWSKRSDSYIAGSVENVLMWNAFLPKDSVKAMVEDGWVTFQQ
jgi:hypothetical protein